MRASIILALASLMSNMTEALKVTDAGDLYGPVELFETDDCFGISDEVMTGPFCLADRPWCKSASSVYVPTGKTLVVKYSDQNDDPLTLDIVGDDACVNLSDFVLSNGGFASEADFKISAGNVKFTY